MRYFLTFLILFLVIVFQVNLASKLALFSIVPNLALIVVVLWVVFRGEEGIVVAFLTGLFLDLFLGQTGITTLTFLLIAFAVLIIKENVLGVLNFLAIITILALSTLLFDISYLFYLKLTGYEIVFIEYFYRLALPEVVYNLILGILGYFILGKYFTWLSKWEHQAKLPEKIR